MCRAFLRLVGLEREASIVNVGTWGMLAVMPVGSSYFISKLAQGRLSEAIPLAYPKVSSINFHPAMTVTDMANSHPEVLHFSKDTGMLILPLSSISLANLGLKVELAAGTAVYLASPQAKFLSGRYMSSNWDVDELEARKDEVIKKDLLKIDLKGEFGSQLFA